MSEDASGIPPLLPAPAPIGIPPLLPEPAAEPASVVLRRLFLTLFLRGRGARGLLKRTAAKSIGQKLTMVLLVYGLVGLLALAFLRQTVFALGVYLHAMTFTFLGMYVASSAGEVLFNREENDILLHRPISPRTMLWAKIRVLVEVSIWVAAAFNLTGLFVGMAVVDGGWRFPLVHACSTVLEALFCTGSVVLSYQLCLKWFGRSRLEGLITTAQVVVSIGAVMAGQIVPRVLFRVDTQVWMRAGSIWTIVLPPAWFAGLDDAWAGSGSANSWWLGLGALGATAAVLGISFGLLARSYEAGMQAVNETAPTRVGTHGRRRWLDRLVNQAPLGWCFPDPVVRASFILTGAYLFRDRDVKLRLYPGLAPMLVLPFVMLFQNREIGHSHHGGGLSAFLIAFSGCYLGMIPLSGVTLLQHSQQWQASDVFRAAPLAGPAAICRGGRWAVLVFLTLPMLLIFGAVLWLLHGVSNDWVVLLSGVVTLPIYALLPNLKGAAAPLSRPTEEAKSTGRGAIIIGGMLVSGLIAAMAAAARAFGWFWPFLAVETAVTGGVYWLFSRSVDAAVWPAME